MLKESSVERGAEDGSLHAAQGDRKGGTRCPLSAEALPAGGGESRSRLHPDASCDSPRFPSLSVLYLDNEHSSGNQKVLLPACTLVESMTRRGLDEAMLQGPRSFVWERRAPVAKHLTGGGASARLPGTPSKSVQRKTSHPDQSSDISWDKDTLPMALPAPAQPGITRSELVPCVQRHFLTGCPRPFGSVVSVDEVV